MEKLIYIVDDEPQIAELLGHLLAVRNKNWKIKIHKNPLNAIKNLESEKPDIVISDYCMPEMQGTEFLENIRIVAPNSLRVLISGNANPTTIATKLTAAHQFLAKPFSPSIVALKIEKALNAFDRLQDPKVQTMVMGLKTLPALPEIYFQLLETLDNYQADIQDISKILKQDGAIMAKVIQLANSPLFAKTVDWKQQPTMTVSPNEAIGILGTERLKATVMEHQMFKDFNIEPNQLATDLLDKNRGETAKLTHQTAIRMQLKDNESKAAFAAGLMHDLGRLVLIDNYPQQYKTICKRAKKEKKPITELEKEIFKITQADVSSFLVSLWGLDQKVATALEFQEKPWEATDKKEQKIATALYITKELVAIKTNNNNFPREKIKTEFIAEIGLKEYLDLTS